MDLKMLAELKSKFVAREVGNELILVPLANNVAKMSELFTLNETAKFIWEKSGEVTTLDEMGVEMCRAFNIDSETAHIDIATFVEHLKVMFNKSN